MSGGHTGVRLPWPPLDDELGFCLGFSLTSAFAEANVGFRTKLTFSMASPSDRTQSIYCRRSVHPTDGSLLAVSQKIPN